MFFFFLANIKSRFNTDFTTFDNGKTVETDASSKPKTFGVENDISWILSGRRNQNNEIQKALDRRRQTTSYGWFLSFGFLIVRDGDLFFGKFVGFFLFQLV